MYSAFNIMFKHVFPTFKITKQLLVFSLFDYVYFFNSIFNPVIYFGRRSMLHICLISNCNIVVTILIIAGLIFFTYLRWKNLSHTIYLQTKKDIYKLYNFFVALEFPHSFMMLCYATL